MRRNLTLAAVTLSVLSSAIVTAPSFASISKRLENLPRYQVVDTALVRGAQPSEQGLKLLKDGGVKTVINLRNNHTTVKDEEIVAKQLGLNYVSIPLDGIHKPSAAAIKQFLSVVQDHAAQPVFVHCEHGEDRTGVMVAIYREEAYKWKADMAYQEAVIDGFHPAYFWLTDAVFDYEEQKGLKRSANRPFAVKVRDSFEQAFSFWKPKKVATNSPVVAVQATPTPKT